MIVVPASPAFTPCPDGWPLVDDDDIALCEPWTAPPPESCEADEGIFPGEEGCVRVGTECPAGDFPEGLPTDARVYYVSATAAAGGDGSEAAPFARIGDALARAFAGSVVAVGKGSYDGTLRPKDGVTLWGACVAETILTNTDSPDPRGGVVESDDEDITVRNLQITASGQPGIACTEGCAADVQDVVVNGGAGAGIVTGFGATLTGRSIVVRDIASDDLGYYGRGLAVDSSSTAEVSRAFFEGNHEIGVAVFIDASLVLSDAFIRGTLPQARDDLFGRGLSVELGAMAEARRLVLADNHDTGIFVNEGARLVAEDVVVRDTLPAADSMAYGRGVSVQTESTFELRRARIERNREISVYCGGDGAVLQAEDILVRDTQMRQSDGVGGRGMAAELGCSATVARGLFVRNQMAGVSSFQSSVDLMDVTIDTVTSSCIVDPCLSTELGLGIGAYSSGGLTATRFRITASGLCGVQVEGEAALDISAGLVERAEIGACVQVPDYDFDRLTDDVVYRDNGTNLETTELPVPPTLGSL
jgi:hypothetical protein